VPHRLLMLLVGRIVETVHQLPSLLRDSRRYETPILDTSLASYKICLFHSIEQSRCIRHPIQQPLAHLIPAQTTRLGAPQDPQDIVLRARNSMRLEHLLERVAELIGCANDVELRLLAKRPKRLRLLDLFLECW
jgi:hypothetical protein